MSFELPKNLNPDPPAVNGHKFEQGDPATKTSKKKTRKAAPQPCANRVRLLLLRHGITYTEIARQLGVSSQSSIARVVYGHYRVPEIREGIARLVNLPVEALWPERPSPK